MSARTPGDCDRLFEEHVNAGAVEAVVALYEEGGSLVRHDGGVATGHAAIREVIARLVAIHPKLRNDVVRVVSAGEDLALVYNDWRMSAKGRREADGEGRQGRRGGAPAGRRNVALRH